MDPVETPCNSASNVFTFRTIQSRLVWQVKDMDLLIQHLPVVYSEGLQLLWRQLSVAVHDLLIQRILKTIKYIIDINPFTAIGENSAVPA